MRRPSASQPPRLTTALAGYTGYLLRRAYMQALDCAREALPGPNRVRDFVILTLLLERGPLSQQELAALTGINRTIMVKLIDGLESRGLVARTRNKTDRRSYALQPTDTGRAVLCSLLPAVDRGDDAFTARLSAAQRRRLNQLLLSLLNDAVTAAAESLLDRTGYLVNRAHQVMRTRAMQALAPLSVEPRHFGVLTIVEELQPCSQQQLADELGISAPVALELVGDLERTGLVRRARNAADRRAYDLTLTEEGAGRLHAARTAVAVIDTELVARLGTQAAGELRELLATLLGGTRC